MIYYGKLFDLMKVSGKNKAHIRSEKIIGQETLRKLIVGTGILDEYDFKVRCTNPPVIDRRRRETSIDTKSIESLCTWLNCQPSDIMEVIPNTWDNRDHLCSILNCTPEELPNRVPMKDK